MFESVGRPTTPNWKLRLIGLAVCLPLTVGMIWVFRIMHMPLKSFGGSLPLLSQDEIDIGNHLKAHVTYLATAIGERNLSRPETLQAASSYLQNILEQEGYAVAKQNYSVGGRTATNLEVRIAGGNTNPETIVVGAHYDSALGTPGANDNASGVAAVLELARLFHPAKTKRAIRFVLFANEEPPYFQTDEMGSVAYAKQLRHDHVQVVAMISLETLGYYSDKPGSQRYPPVLSLFYPSRGDFVGFVANSESRELVRLAIRRFRETTKFPSEGVAAPSDWPGIGWSDQWAFWQQGYPAIMVTDTAIFRYPYYHTSRDTENQVDFARMARVVGGVRRVVESLATD